MAEDKDLIVSFGCDHTLLRTSSAIYDYNLPLLAISTAKGEE